jgi:hypothetical protein
MIGRRIAACTLSLAVLGTTLVASVPPVRADHTSDENLPDLVMLAPNDFVIQQRPRGGRWLRFSTVIVNLGPGVFQVYGADSDGASVGDVLPVVQQIQEPTGGFSTHASTATMFYSGDGHDHWHVRDLQEWTLQNSNAQVLARGAKTGFCFWDNYNYGATTLVYYHPSTTDACEIAPSGRVPMGLSVGWGDMYPSNIAFQYIDISGLPNGVYKVTVAADPPLAEGGRFIEANEGNNSSWARIQITRKTVTVLELAPAP